ncbi:uncharacterized protein N7473_008059 [Penicillium subrubescens]|uniref:THUMP domain-containing protein n=1 Tax=Penicillium subrubescens TaxID=1316194 RepID=A0A1Q5TFE1_9EURO|nr:uncharacterized protein N7473_008059 [Penicillium subrubescens]KAJ5891831.1 hypothetical protein N7473_008059 [Penicillium subrubescens]OKO98949.1 hypothetical protein PENSUB_8866 [Penicillium subrubescens]
MAGGKRSMPGNANQSAKRQKGQKSGKPAWQASARKINIDTGDVGVIVTCDMGREGKCVAETLDIFSQALEEMGKLKKDDDDDEDDEDEGDIEAQIQRELAGLKPNKDKKRPFEAIRLEMPCVIFVRLEKSIDPVELVHRLCAEAQANPETKKSRYVKRMTPVTEVRKTLSVDLEAFAREILKPHFHSGGPPKKYAIRPSVRGNNKFNRDAIIKTVADVVGKEHPVNLKNYDQMILVDVCQNIIGMSVVGSDYDQLKRFNLAEIYDPAPKPEPKEDSKEGAAETKS